MGWKDRLPASQAAAQQPATTAATAQPAPVVQAPVVNQLPPIQQAPAQQALPSFAPPAAPVAQQAPPASATPAPAATPRRGRRPSTTTTPPAAANAVVAQVPNNLVFAGPQVALPGFLAKFVPTAQQQPLAVAFALANVSGSEPNIFPTSFITSGSNGGSLKLDEMNPEGSNANMHDGSKPQYCVVIGYRMLMTIWSKAYNKDDKDRPAPLWKAVVGPNDGDLGALAIDAVKNYQYRNRALNERFDPFGHPSLSVEFLCFDPQAGLYATRTCTSVESATRSLDTHTRGLPDIDNDPAKGKIVVPYPAKIEIVPFDVGSKSNAWKDYHFFIQRFQGPETQSAATEFQQFISTAASDPDLMADVEAWLGTTVSPAQQQALEQILGVKGQ